jgi:hypothetical protein
MAYFFNTYLVPQLTMPHWRRNQIVCGDVRDLGQRHGMPGSSARWQSISLLGTDLGHYYQAGVIGAGAIQSGFPGALRCSDIEFGLEARVQPALGERL